MALESTDARNKLEDLSGITIQTGDNPYKALIQACNNDTVCMFTSMQGRKTFPVFASQSRVPASR